MIKEFVKKFAVTAAVCAAALCPSPSAAAVKLAPPASGAYHAAHPDFGLADDAVNQDSVRQFASLAQKKIVWSYFSWHWADGIKFPSNQCRILNDEGVIPLVGIMPWSAMRQGEAEQVYTLDRILRGDFDAELAECADEVHDLGFPIMMEFGPEVNGSWFPWNGAWNGRDAEVYGGKSAPGGPERFRDAYRRVISIFREHGAEDVTWVFHIAASPAPKEAWNTAWRYYPGDGFIDWLGVSVYAVPGDNGSLKSFDEIMKHVYPGLCGLSDSRPIAALELGAPERPEKPGWIAGAFGSVNAGMYPRIKAMSWWNKIYKPSLSRSTLEIDSSPESLAAYREGVSVLVDEAVWDNGSGGTAAE